MYELTAIYDSRKSFYGKATVSDDGTAKRLYSYGTHVVTIHTATGEVALMPAWEHSATTLRHVKEFLLQNGKEAGSKAEIRKRYATA